MKHLSLLAVGILAVVVALQFGAESASASRKQVRSGDWIATISFSKSRMFGTRVYRKLKFSLAHGRQKIVRKRKVRLQRNWSRDAGTAWGSAPKLLARNLDSDPDPEFVVSWYTGGAHCCTLGNVFGAIAANAKPISFAPYDAPLDLRDLDSNGIFELLSFDHRFNYQFASFASSAFVTQIRSFANGRNDDVTRNFPAQIQANADWHLQKWTEARDEEGGGFAFGYAADLCLLGRANEAFQFLQEASTNTYMPGDDTAPELNPNFFNETRAFLQDWNYC